MNIKIYILFSVHCFLKSDNIRTGYKPDSVSAESADDGHLSRIVVTNDLMRTTYLHPEFSE